ncbi:hypothetical protein ACFQE0_25720 [Methylobacterium komagatae]|uniref:Uncharacterized protein n=1 Tax=Methylobacterium komagatae TaxID=374425 RepID=A0ABW2BQ90_9HYPH
MQRSQCFTRHAAIVAIATLGVIVGPAIGMAAGYTGTGGGPETTANAPYRSSVGQTVPPGRSAAPDIDPNSRTERQKQLDSVLDSICNGC